MLKHIKNWSFRELYSELQRNLDYKAFTQFFAEKIRSASALCRNLAWIDDQALACPPSPRLRRMNEFLCHIALRRGVIKGRRFRQDTTVCETNIHFPTDHTLLRDGVRVLQRLVSQAQELLPSLGRTRDRSRAVLHRVLEIDHARKDSRETAQKRQQESHRGLLRITRSVVTEASRVAANLGDGRRTRHLDMVGQLAARGVKAQLETMMPRVERVIRQTRARVFRGDTRYPDKILSLFVPETAVICKGKAGKRAEFGRLIDVVEVENGFVSDYQVLDGNPCDGTLLIPAIGRHKARFGRAPHTVATDRGYWSAANEQRAYALGVRRVSLPARGKLSKA